MNELPDYYFRIRDNGATVFRVDSDNPHRRIEMDQIAVINTNRGDYKAYGDTQLTDRDTAAIMAWLADRTAVLKRRALDDIYRAVDDLNLTAHWVQAKASDAELESVTEPLLMAMHDLRSVLVRKMADRVLGKDT